MPQGVHKGSLAGAGPALSKGSGGGKGDAEAQGGGSADRPRLLAPRAAGAHVGPAPGGVCALSKVKGTSALLLGSDS